jgi:NADH-quinone oxidoreductase subunit A
VSDSLVPAVLTVVVSAGVAISMLVLSRLLGRPRKSRVDTTAYECGISHLDPVERHRFSVKFYLVAMLFILFDIEVAFLYPWAVTFRGFSADRVFVLVEMAVFLGILVVGFLYLWWRGALNWE